MPRLSRGLLVQEPPRVLAYADDVDPSIEGLMAAQGIEAIPFENTLDEEVLGKTFRKTGAAIGVVRTSSPLLGAAFDALEVGVHAACKGPLINPKDIRGKGKMALRANQNGDQVAANIDAHIRGIATGVYHSMGLSRLGNWGKKETGGRIFEPHELTVGILGFGDVGQRVAIKIKDLVGEVIVFNHEHTIKRKYDERLREIAQELGVRFADSKEDLLRNSHMLSIHIGKQDALGGSNAGAVTVDDLLKLRSVNGGGGILLNGARAEVTASAPKLNQLLKNGKLHSVVLDVLPKEQENANGFHLPRRYHPALSVTQHICGSGGHIARATAVEVARNLEIFLRTGAFSGNALTYPHLNLAGVETMLPNSLHVQIHRATALYTLRGINDAIANAGLEDLGGSESFGDFIPGMDPKSEGSKWDIVPHNFALGINGSDYETAAAQLASELSKLGQRIASVRFMPQTQDQKEALWGINWAGLDR